jgi:hypothetical protein
MKCLSSTVSALFCFGVNSLEGCFADFPRCQKLCACVCGMILLASGHLTSNPVLQSYVRVSGYGRMLVLGRECSSLSVSRMPMRMLCVSDIFSCFQRLKIAKSQKP